MEASTLSQNIIPSSPKGHKRHFDSNEVVAETAELILPDGMRIAYQEWFPQSGKCFARKVLALHGWLDNSNSFVHVGPHLASLGYHCIAIDHVGHGKSSHIGLEAQYTIPAYVGYVHDVLIKLGWEKPSIVAHSMGAFIATLFAGCFPEKVHRLVLIEGMVPLTADPDVTAKNLRKSIESMHKFQLKASNTGGGKAKTPKVYSTFAAAVDARMKSVAMYPGKQTLSVEATRHLVGRGTYRVDGVSGAPLAHVHTDTKPVVVHDRDNVDGDGAVRYRHDPRLVIFAGVSLTDDQVLAVVREITAKTLLITGDNGWPMSVRQEAYASRIQTLIDKGLLTCKHLTGSHHLHLDPDTAPVVCSELTAFFQPNTE